MKGNTRAGSDFNSDILDVNRTTETSNELYLNTSNLETSLVGNLRLGSEYIANENIEEAIKEEEKKQSSFEAWRKRNWQFWIILGACWR